MNQITPLSPLREITRVQGICCWNDDRRKMIINKPLRIIFNEMNKRTAKINYWMEFCMNKERLHEKFHEHLENDRFPIFLFFYKGEETGMAG